MKIEFLLLPEDGEQSEKKLNESLCSTRCGMAALQRESTTAHMAKGLLIHSGTLWIISQQPCPRARPRRHAARRARGEIFRLLLPTGQSKS